MKGALLLQLPCAVLPFVTTLVMLKLIVFPASTPAPVMVSKGWVKPMKDSSVIVPVPSAKMLDAPDTCMGCEAPVQVLPPLQLMQLDGELVTPTRVPTWLDICRIPLSGITRAAALTSVGAKANPIKATAVNVSN